MSRQMIAKPHNLEPGSIILTALPQADGNSKRRPALILTQMPGYGDFLVCGISSQIKQEIPGFDEVIKPDADNGLKMLSVVRLGFLQVIPGNQVIGTIGRIPNELHTTLLQRLASYLTRKI